MWEGTWLKKEYKKLIAGCEDCPSFGGGYVCSGNWEYVICTYNGRVKVFLIVDNDRTFPATWTVDDWIGGDPSCEFPDECELLDKE